MSIKEPLSTSLYFQSPIYHVEAPEWVKSTNKVCDTYINQARKNLKKTIKDREKKTGKKIGDHGLSYHSTSLIGDPKLKELQEYIGATSWNVMDHMGYDMSGYELFWTEFWVQEFADKGGGHHDGHIHYDNHISGFYFLECSENTSMPVFQDPRLAKVMTQLPLKKPEEISFGSDKIHYKPKPGTMIFFPAYLEHQYTVDDGVEPFRFIHFNLQAVRRMITDTVRTTTKEKK